MPTPPATTRATAPMMAISRFIMFFVIYPPWAMLSEAMKKPRNTKRETEVRHGSWKNKDMSGAERKRMMYSVADTATLKVKTAL